MTDDIARSILLRGADSLAHADGLGTGLGGLLEAMLDGLGVASAAVVVVGPSRDREIVASAGLPAPAADGLRDAMRDPDHPVTRAFGDPGPTFDVAPTRPGGPPLRSHLPLTVTRAGAGRVVGVLALAHERPLDEPSRALAVAVGDLAAVRLAVEA